MILKEVTVKDEWVHLKAQDDYLAIIETQYGNIRYKFKGSDSSDINDLDNTDDLDDTNGSGDVEGTEKSERVYNVEGITVKKGEQVIHDGDIYVISANSDRDVKVLYVIGGDEDNTESDNQDDTNP